MNSSNNDPCPTINTNAVEYIVDHYQKTYEVTYDLWKQRNRLFLILVGVVSLGTILSLKIPEANSIFVDCLAGYFQITDTVRNAELRNSFPFSILQGAFLIVVFYLMVNLYHRAAYVLRNYQYLGEVEQEIRKLLNLPKDSVAFARESSFYWQNRGMMIGSVKWFYIILLGSLLFTFLGMQIYTDVLVRRTIPIIIDLIAGGPVIVFYFAYAITSISLDRYFNKSQANSP